MGTPTRLFSGLSTRPKGRNTGDYPLPDPFKTSASAGLGVASYSTDFLDLGNVASRTITGAGSVLAVGDGLGGLAVLTPGGAAVATTLARTAASWQFIAGQKLWCVHRLKASSIAGNVVMSVGLSKSTAGTLATTDRVFFTKLAASTAINLVSVVNNVSTTLAANISTALSDTFFELAFYFDGTDLFAYSSDVLIARIPNVTIGASGTTLSSAVMTPFVAITPVATETITMDYALVAQELAR